MNTLDNNTIFTTISITIQIVKFLDLSMRGQKVCIYVYRKQHVVYDLPKSNQNNGGQQEEANAIHPPRETENVNTSITSREKQK